MYNEKKIKRLKNESEPASITLERINEALEIAENIPPNSELYKNTDIIENNSSSIENVIIIPTRPLFSILTVFANL